MTVLEKNQELLKLTPPVTGRTLKEDGTVVNRADLAVAQADLAKELEFGPIYQDATYKYFGEASPGALLTAPAWRVSRMKLSDSRIQWADGDSDFDNIFTDLSTVAAFSYVLP